MRKLDAIKAMLLAATANGALANIEKHEIEKDYALGKPAVTLTANTSTEGAYYIAELISQLSEENG